MGPIASWAEVRLPELPIVVDVTRPTYSANGDDVTDDTEALQRALNENVFRHRALFFPRGSYLVSRPLSWPKRWNGRDNCGMKIVWGGSRRTERCSGRKTTPSPTRRNRKPLRGAAASVPPTGSIIRSNSSRSTSAPAIRAPRPCNSTRTTLARCRFVAGYDSGAVGLDLARPDMNGPLLVRRCEVVGFRSGIATGHSVNSQTFEHLTLVDQGEFGFDNQR